MSVPDYYEGGASARPTELFGKDMPETAGKPFGKPVVRLLRMAAFPARQTAWKGGRRSDRREGSMLRRRFFVRPPEPERRPFSEGRRPAPTTGPRRYRRLRVAGAERVADGKPSGEPDAANARRKRPPGRCRSAGEARNVVRDDPNGAAFVSGSPSPDGGNGTGSRTLAPSPDGTGVASRRNQKARDRLRAIQADRSPATGESAAMPAPQLRLGATAHARALFRRRAGVPLPPPRYRTGFPGAWG